MKLLLWLDDLRNPYLDHENRVPRGDWNIVWVRSFVEFRAWIIKEGLPDAISFDHDLHPQHYTPDFFWNDYDMSKKYQEHAYPRYDVETGLHCAQWLVANRRLLSVDKFPEIFVHSANPVGADFIKEALSKYKGLALTYRGINEVLKEIDGSSSYQDLDKAWREINMNKNSYTQSHYEFAREHIFSLLYKLIFNTGRGY